MQCNRRTVLSAVAGGTAVAAAGRTTARSGRPGPREDGPVDAAGSLESRLDGDPPVTLEGTVTTPPVSTGDRLLVGSDRGLYVFADGELASFVPTRSVRRVRPLGDGRAVVLVRDVTFPNVLAVDLAEGSIEWSTARSQSVYSQQFGEIDRQVGAFDARPIGDTTGDGTTDVAVAVGYGVVGLDGTSGEPLWEVDHDGYVWELAVLDGTVYASTQDGRLLAVDAASGERRWAVRLAEPFRSGRGTVVRSVWSVEPLPEAGDLVVTTEAGDLVRVSADDGSEVWRTTVLDLDADAFDRYFGQHDFRPTMPDGPDRSADEGFFGVEVSVVEDAPPQLLVRAREVGRRGRRENPGQLVLVDADGEVAWRNEGVDLGGAGNVRCPPGGDAVLVPSGPAGDTQEVVRFDRADGRQRDPLAVPAVPTSERRRRPEGEGYVGVHGGNPVVASTVGDLVALDDDDAVAWSFPAVREGAVERAEFLGDGTEDVLVHSRNTLPRSNTLGARTLVVRSGEDGSVAWSKALDAETFAETGGLRGLRPLPAGDAGVDLLAFEQRPRSDADDKIRDLERQLDQLLRRRARLENRRDDNQEEIADVEAQIESVRDEIEQLGGRRVAELVVLSGRDGSERRRIPLTIERDGSLDALVNPTSIDVLGGGLALVGGQQRIVLVALGRGEVTWSRRYQDEALWPPVDGRRVEYRTVETPGGIEDIVAVAGDDPAVGVIETEFTGEDILMEKAGEVDLDGDHLATGSLETLPDLDGDGYEEVACRLRGEDGTAHVVVSPGEQRVLHRAESAKKPPSVWTGPNPTGEGNGLLSCTIDGDRFAVSATDGAEEVWREQWDVAHRSSVPRQGYRPAAPVGSAAGDGDPVIAVAKTAAGPGAKVDLYAVESGERLDSIELAPFEERFDPDEDPVGPALLAERLPDLTGDGEPELGVVVDATGTGDHEFYVVDPVEREVLTSGPTPPSEFAALPDGVGMVGYDASFLSFGGTTGVTIEGRTTGSEVALSWRFDDDRERVTTVAADGRPVAVTTDRSAAVRLPPGSHTVALSATDPAGVTVHEQTTVTVGGGTVTDLLLYAAAGVSVAGLLGVSAVPAIRRRVQG
jgi:outer membrane protein assembly factor BamB